jgi:FkbM family methyltransferase
MFLTRWFYYFISIPTVLIGFTNWPVLLGVHKQPFILRLRSGLQFKIKTLMDAWILKETCLDRQYEKASVEIEDGWTVMDIGAAAGDFSICVGKFNPKCKIYAFEPYPPSYALLQENLKLNGVTNVRGFPLAVGGRRGPVKLKIAGEDVQHSTVVPAGSGQNALEVEGRTLDEVFAGLKLTKCDYLKIDCEGAEFAILFKASYSTLDAIGHICLEYHDGVTAFNHNDLTEFFEKNGFIVHSKPNPVHKNLGMMYAYHPGWHSR